MAAGREVEKQYRLDLMAMKCEMLEHKYTHLFPLRRPNRRNRSVSSPYTTALEVGKEKGSVGTRHAVGIGSCNVAD